MKIRYANGTGKFNQSVEDKAGKKKTFPRENTEDGRDGPGCIVDPSERGNRGSRQGRQGEIPNEHVLFSSRQLPGDEGHKSTDEKDSPSIHDNGRWRPTPGYVSKL